jgi:hypothetical protein
MLSAKSPAPLLPSPHTMYSGEWWTWRWAMLKRYIPHRSPSHLPRIPTVARLNPIEWEVVPCSS